MTTHSHLSTWPERLALMIIVLIGVGGAGIWTYLLW